MKAALIALLGAFALVAGAPAASASLVTEWNALALNYVRAMRTPPPVAARMLAILHASIFDAVNGISPSYQYYIVPSSLAPRAASVNAAASGAARDALNALFPGFASQTNQTFEAKLIASLDSPAAEAAGVAWGVQVAAAVLANRTDDGSQHIDYSLPDLAPGIW